MPAVEITFHGDLPQLLKKKIRGQTNVTYALDRRASVKDVCEALGVPHPEIDTIYANSHEVGFDYIVSSGDSITVIPISEKTDFFKSTLLRPVSLTGLRFIADVNVGKLARWLRLCGFDTWYDNNFDDDELAEIAGTSNRILLTKDCNLLKRKNVVFGHLVRKNDPEDQIIEVVKLFNLQNRIQPYSRCLRCNGTLRQVNKKEVDHLLEPLTRKYYKTFHQCCLCHQVYWHGSHRPKIEKNLQSVLLKCGIAVNK
jgi:uncharacterized protein with PIN domain